MMPTKKSPALILIRGLPGSGKSFIAAKLQKKLGNDSVILLDPDAVDYESSDYLQFSAQASAEGVDSKLHPYRFLRSQAHDGIKQGKYIVWNQAFTNLEIFHKMISGLETYAAENNAKLAVLVVEVEIDVAVAKQRVLEREKMGYHGVPTEVFDRFVRDYKSFSNEGFHLVKVDGLSSVDIAVAAICGTLETL